MEETQDFIKDWGLPKNVFSSPKYLNMKTDDPEAFTEALNSMLGEMPDVVTDLFFSYARDLPREEIESTANDTELAEAFQEVMKYAFPLSQSLTKVLNRA